MSGKQYSAPDWAASSSADLPQYSLDVIKEGVHIDTIALSPPARDPSFIVFGRQPDAVDVQLDHQSISRQHAVMQYHTDGSLHLFDWAAAAGTFVNKKQLQSGAHERLFVGDVIKFGASSRVYVFNGPESQSREEYDSANVQALRRRLAEQTERAEKQRRLEEAREKEGVSWGFAEDAAEGEEDEEGEAALPAYMKDDPHYERKYGELFTAGIQEGEVHAKDAKLLEKVKQREAKIRHMQEESGKIYAKEGSQDGGLTEGQAATVRRNDMRIVELSAEVRALVQQIQGKESARQAAAGKAPSSESRKEEQEDERGWLDTTRQTADASTNFRLRRKGNGAGAGAQAGGGKAGALGYEELAAERDSLRRAVAASEALAAQLAAEALASEPEDGDAIDAAVRHSFAAEAAAREQRVRGELLLLSDRAALVERLLSIATPTIATLVAMGAAPTPAVPAAVVALTPAAETAEAAEQETVAPASSAPPAVAVARTASVNSISYILQQQGKRKAPDEAGDQEPLPPQRRAVGPARRPEPEEPAGRDERVSSWTAPSQQQQRRVADLRARLGY